ncbi:Stress responsive A/B Barrel Domain [Cyclobacterium xiamenense]|uniref:Stress responsive A/B Barrel Domain n=1 Tax=Cyclobacterium xiamenense TaxID=1297121 RepID=A0A1H6ZRV0_9BACT|nr:Dabb family protein [Cyclobacterium xiamenense]SEJ55958.1 Stress responsive A/B Barrel Domain [Cyclobacterium xiamenense]
MKILKTLSFCLLLVICQAQLAAQEHPTAEKLHHILIIQWADGVDLKLKEEALTLFQRFPEKVDGCEEVSIADITLSSDDFDTIIIMVFESQAAYDAYEAHPDHGRIVALRPKLVKSASIVDYWK